MISLQKVKYRKQRMENSKHSGDINTSQFLNENVINSNLKTLQSSVLDKDMSNYVISILEYSTNYNNQFQNSIRNVIVSDIIPGVKDLNSFKDNLLSRGEIIPNVDILIKSIDENVICDRILHNDESLSKRFNFDKTISDNANIDRCINILCSSIDTYNIPQNSKYNIALENIKYSLSKCGKNISDSQILESVTGYFFIRETPISDAMYIKMKNVLNHTELYDKSTILEVPITKAVLENDVEFSKKVKELANRSTNIKVRDTIFSILNIKTEQDAQNVIYNIGDVATYKNVSDDDKSLLYSSIELIPLVTDIPREFINIQVGKAVDIPGSKYNLIPLQDDIKDIDTVETNIKEMSSSQLLSLSFLESASDNDDMKKLIDKFKAEQIKTETKLKKLVSKIYSQSPEAMIDNLPSMLSIIRISYVGALLTVPYVGPVLAIVTALINWFIKKLTRQRDSEKLLNYLIIEKDRVEHEIENMSTGKIKSRHMQYLNELNRNINKMHEYIELLTGGCEYTNDENFDIFKENVETSILAMFDFVKIVEQAAKLELSAITAIHNDDYNVALSSIVENGYIDNYTMSRQDFNITELDEVAETLLMNDKNAFCDFMECVYRSSLMEYSDILLQKLFYKNYSDNYVAANEVSSVWDKLNSINRTSTNSIYSIVECGLYDMEISKVLTEKSKINTAKLALQNAKRNVKTMSTRIKSASQTANAYANSVMNGIEKSITSDRREAIIKGRVLPSFTQMMKYAITIAAAGIVFQPVTAAITALGIFAANKALTYREKKMILDEIETELKVVEKQINIAENDQDMKQYRLMLNMQKKLIRERQRIKYNMKAVGKNIPVPSVNTKNND